MSTRKQKRQDDVRQAPVAEAIAVGTAVGGLVLGTIEAQGSGQLEQARATTPIDVPGLSERTESRQHVEAPPPPKVLPDADVQEAKGNAAEASDATPLPAQAIAAATAPAVVPATDLAATEHTDAASVPNTIPPMAETQLIAELSEQMTATLVKVISFVEPGQSPSEIGHSVASDIIASAQQIVANLGIGPLLAQAQDTSSGLVAQVHSDTIAQVGQDIVAQLDAPAIAAEVLGATSGIAETVLADMADLPTTILADAVAALPDLPSSLLGNEGPDGPIGLLSEIFYTDGASDSLAISDLGTMADSLPADASGVVGLLGLSYVDVQDHAGGHGLNALSLL